MGGKDDDRKDADALNDKEWFDSWKAQHDQLLSELETESKRLQQDLSRESSSGAARPFSAFKRFIDDGFSSLSSALQDLPSTTAELKSRMQREQERWRAEEQDISERWTGSTDSPDHIQMLASRSSNREKEEVRESMLELLDTANERNAHIAPAKLEALYRDQGLDMGILDLLGDLSNVSLGSYRWLSVDWFKRDPYSPIRLESHHALGEYGAKWRAAFEDLLDASLDKPMGSIERVGMREPFGRHPQSTYYGPGLDWMLSLQCRGILPMQLPRTYSIPGMAPELKGSRWTGILRHEAASTENGRTANPTISADLRDLLSAVGTKAAPDTGADPLPVRIPPETEQDLYDSEYLFPGVSPSSEDHESNGPEKADDAARAQDKSFRDALVRRGYELAGDEFEDFASSLPGIDKLLERVLRLQQEWDSIEESTGAGKASLKDYLEATRSAAVEHEQQGVLAPSHEQQHTEPQAKRPDVLSALTTTHTTRLPDGTVTTKVVLKQRFADGREETTESMHTRNEGTNKSQDETPSQDKTEKKGWFWT